jgi:lysosomal alpha-mannosidase
LIKFYRYINSRSDAGINIFYSTPSCYLKSLHDADTTWPEKSNDFFPYASDIHSFWTGYFTSRPTLKRFERMGNHFLQVCKQLSAVAKDHSKSFEAHLNSLREAMGIMQHHDAVTGTEKQHVADDYARLLHKAFVACESNTKVALQGLVAPDTTKKQNHHVHRFEPITNFEFESCLQLNISECAISSECEEFIVTVYNPLAYNKHDYVRVPVPGSKYLIQDHKGLEIPYQMVPIDQAVLNLNYRVSESTNELVFLATDIPAVGYRQYLVTRLAPDDPEVLMADQPESGIYQNDFSIGTDEFKVVFTSNGLVNGIFVDGKLHDFKQEFFYYEGNVGDNYEAKNRSSGAYIFRPKVNTSEVLVAEEVKYTLSQGDLVDEVHQVFNDWISQVVRVYKKEMYVEFEWMVGPIPVTDKIGKEVITRYTSSINHEGVFYTDSNGREMMKRIRDQRDTWKINLIEKIAGNYYPINTKISIEDKENRFSVLVDRAQGGGSLSDGSIELMVIFSLLIIEIIEFKTYLSHRFTEDYYMTMLLVLERP